MIKRQIQLEALGDSFVLKLSQEDLVAYGENCEDVRFDMVVEEGQITLTPVGKSALTIEELFKDYEGEPLGATEKYDWGEPVGRELF